MPFQKTPQWRPATKGSENTSMHRQKTFEVQGNEVSLCETKIFYCSSVNTTYCMKHQVYKNPKPERTSKPERRYPIIVHNITLLLLARIEVLYRSAFISQTE